LEETVVRVAILEDIRLAELQSIIEKDEPSVSDDWKKKASWSIRPPH
jgi:hypothetical protein